MTSCPHNSEFAFWNPAEFERFRAPQCNNNLRDWELLHNLKKSAEKHQNLSGDDCFLVCWVDPWTMTVLFINDESLAPRHQVDPGDGENYTRMIELWFQFCLMWSVCGSVDEEGRRRIDTFIREMDGSVAHILSCVSLRPRSHMTRNTCRRHHANSGTHCCEWECSHSLQVTSNLCTASCVNWV